MAMLDGISVNNDVYMNGDGDGDDDDNVSWPKGD